MKSNVLGMFLAVGAACVSGSALNAQTNDVSAKVPFAFHVAGKSLPAGRYLVTERGYLGIPFVQNSATGESVFVAGASHSLTRVGPARLVFHCYAGGTCFLAEIRPPASAGSTIAMTKAEKVIRSGDKAREMATITIDLRSGD